MSALSWFEDERASAMHAAEMGESVDIRPNRLLALLAIAIEAQEMDRPTSENEDRQAKERDHAADRTLQAVKRAYGT